MSCKICGDVAQGINYGVFSCMSCKVFFQRHGIKQSDSKTTIKCRFRDGPCQISVNTRKHCIYCRLTACLQAGMRKKLKPSQKKIPKQQQLINKNLALVQQKYKQAHLITLDLLHADRSSLNTYQWSIISNVTHIYDTLFEQHKQQIVQLHIFDEQKPMKMRLKLSNYQKMVATYFTFIGPFLERIPDYQSLEPSNRSILLHHNLVTLTGIYSHYMASITGFIPYFDKNYASIMNMIYGNRIVSENERLRQKIDIIFHTDLILIKLVLVILAFGNVTPCLTILPETISKSVDDDMIFSKRLLKIQNDYIDILWRYMLFRFRHEEIVTHLYSNIIYNCLHVQNFSCQVAEQNDVHKNIYDDLLQQVETKLSLQDEI